MREWLAKTQDRDGRQARRNGVHHPAHRRGGAHPLHFFRWEGRGRAGRRLCAADGEAPCRRAVADRGRGRGRGVPHRPFGRALVVATETTEHADGSVTTSPVLSGGEPIVLEECLPAVTGVLIVAEGADDLSVRFNLLEAAASVLDINQSLIKVYTKGGSQLL